MTKLPLEVAELLQENAINGQVLESLTEEDLISVGVDKFGWRRQLLLSRQELVEQLEQDDAVSEGDGSTEIIAIHSPAREGEGSPKRFPLDMTPPQPYSTSQESGSKAGSVIMPAKVQPPVFASPSFFGSPAASGLAGSLQGTETSETAATKEIRSWQEQKAVDAHHLVDAHVPVAAVEISVPVESAGVAYKVDNSRLRSGLDGLEFHRSMSLSDTHGRAVAPWGAVVYGTPSGNGWVKVGDFFLPTRLKGAQVLQRLLRNPRRPTASGERVVLPPSRVIRRHSPRGGLAAPTSMSWTAVGGYALQGGAASGSAAARGHFAAQQKASPRSVTLSPNLAPRATAVVQAWRPGVGALGALLVPGVQHSVPNDGTMGQPPAQKAA